MYFMGPNGMFVFDGEDNQATQVHMVGHGILKLN